MHKRIIALLLAALSFCLAACGSNNLTQLTEETVQPREMIDLLSLQCVLLDDNQAKAEQYIGRGTMVYGTVKKVYSDYCIIDVLFDDEDQTVYMPTDVLASLIIDEYVAINALVKDVLIDADENFYYVFSEGYLEDRSLIDEHFYSKVELYRGARMYYMIDAYYADICGYLQSYGDKNLIANQAELEAIIPGQWHISGQAQDKPFTFHEDGRLTHPKRTVVNEWSVKDGKLKIDQCISIACPDMYGTQVYKLYDNILVGSHHILYKIPE